MATRTDLISQDPLVREAIDTVACGFLRNERVQTFHTHLMNLIEKVVGSGWNMCKERYGSKTGMPTPKSTEIYRNGLSHMLEFGLEHWTEEQKKWSLGYSTLVVDFGKTVDAYCASLYQQKVNKKQKIDITLKWPPIATFLKVFFDFFMVERDVASGAYFQGVELDRCMVVNKVLRNTLYELMESRKYIQKVEILDDKPQRHDQEDEEKHLKDATMANVERSKPKPEDLETPDMSDMSKALKDLVTLGLPAGAGAGDEDDEKEEEHLFEEEITEPAPMEEAVEEEEKESGAEAALTEADREVDKVFQGHQVEEEHTDMIAEQDQSELERRPAHPIPRRSISYTPSPAGSSVSINGKRHVEEERMQVGSPVRILSRPASPLPLPVFARSATPQSPASLVGGGGGGGGGASPAGSTKGAKIGGSVVQGSSSVARPKPVARSASAPYDVRTASPSVRGEGASRKMEEGGVKDVRQRMLNMLREKREASPLATRHAMESVEADAQAVIDDISPDDSASNVSARTHASKISRSSSKASSSITQELLNTLEQVNGKTTIEGWLRNSPLQMAKMEVDGKEDLVMAEEEVADDDDVATIMGTRENQDNHGSPRSMFTIEGDE